MPRYTALIEQIAARLGWGETPPDDRRRMIQALAKEAPTTIENARYAINRHYHIGKWNRPAQPRGGNRPGAGRKPALPDTDDTKG